jgi:hypothetical protein
MKKATEARKTYDSILDAITRGDWAETEARFRAFGALYHLPAWYVDETIYQAMKLWKAERVRDLVRHFALVLDRVVGRPVCWNPDDGQRLEAALAAAA